MKKLLFMAVACMLSLAACGEKEGSGSEGPDGPEVSLSDCVVPASVPAGGEGTVQWNGFKQTDRLFLSASAEYELTVRTVTSSGLVFKVPYEVPEGKYTLVLARDAKTELGAVTVTAPENPVTGVKVPSDAVAGESVAVSGLGFEDGCRIVLENAAGEKIYLEAELTGSGITVVLEDVAAGVYKVYLEQFGRTWLLSESMTVRASAAAVKTLTAVRYYAPYLEGSEIMMEWMIDRDSPVTLTLSRYIVENQAESLDVQDIYIQDADGVFVLDEDGFEESNTLEVSYVLDSGQSVTGSDVLWYGHDDTTPFAWTYDSGGHLTGISSPTVMFRSFGYEGNNMTMYHQTSFEYDADCLSNNSDAYDVIWGYMALQEYRDPFVVIPYLLGWYAPQSSKLPSRMIVPSPTGTGTDAHELSYEFDEDGYVVEMSWIYDSSVYRVEYQY